MSSSTSRFTRMAVIFSLVAAAFLAPQSALADTTVSTWNGGTADWALGTNWDANGVPSATVSAVFNASPAFQPGLTGASTAQGIWVTGDTNYGTISISGAQTLVITGTATLNSLANAGILLDGAGNNGLTIDSSVTSTTVSNSTSFLVNNAGTLTIASPLAITAGQVLTLGGTGAAGNTLISGATTATTGAITVNTAGTVTLSGNNLNTGATTLTAGTLIAKTSAGALGAGALSLGGGTLWLTNASGTNLAFNRNTTVTGSMQITSDVNVASTAGNTYTLGTLGIGAQTLTIAGGANVNSGTAGVTFGAVTSSGSSTFTVNNPANGGTTLLTLASIVPTAGSTLTFNGTGNTTVTGVLGATSAAVTKSGSGILTLSGANTFTGGVTLTDGTLNINNATALGATAGALIINGGTINQTVTSVTLTANNPITIGADFAYTGTNNLNLGTGAITNAGSRTITLNGTTKTLTMGGVMTNSAGAIQTTTVNGAGNTLSLGGYALSNSATNYIDVINGTGNVTITGAVTDGGTATASGLTYSGSGTLTLSGTNTFRGGVTLTSGTLKIGNATGLGATAGKLTIAGGTLDGINITMTANNPQDWNADFTYSGASGTLSLGTGAVTMSAARTVTVSASTLTVGGPIGGAGGNALDIIKAGNGTLVLSSAVTMSGPQIATVNAGTMQISGIITGSGVGITKAGAGTLVLSGNNTVFTGSSLNINAGTVSGATSLNAFGSVANSNTINLGAASGSDNAVLDYGLNGTWIATPINVQSGSGTRTIQASADTPTVPGAIILANDLTIGLPSNNITLGGGITGTGNVNITGTAVKTLTIQTGALGYTGNLTNNFTGTGAGVVTISAPINITGSIADNSAGTGAMTISGAIGPTVTGITQNSATSVLILSGANASTGGVIINNAGVVRANNGTGLNTNSLLTINNGVFETGANLERGGGAGQGQMQITGGTSGFSAFGAPVQVAFGSIASPDALIWGAGAFQPATFVLNAVTANNTIDFKNAIDLGASARTVQVDAGGANVATMSGVLSGSGGGITKAGAGMLALSGTNIYTGATTVSAGVLRLDSANALPGGIGSTGGTSNLTFNGSVVGLGAGDFLRPLNTVATPSAANFTGNGGWAAYGADRVVNLGGASAQIAWAAADVGFNAKTVILGASTATNKVTLQNPLDLGNAVRTVQVDDGTAAVDAELGGVLSGAGGGLTKTGAGTLLLSSASNSYTGVTTVSAGVLLVSSLASAGASSNIGAYPTAGAAGLVLGGGTLRYTGDTTSIDRGITLSAASTIDVNKGGTALTLGDSSLGAFQLNVTGGSGSSLGLGATTVTGNATFAPNIPLTLASLSGSNQSVTFGGTAASTVTGAATFSDSATITNNYAMSLSTINETAAAAKTITLTGTGTGSVSGAITQNAANALAITKSGTGTWTLSGANTYTGITSVTAGVLVLNNATALPGGIGATGGTSALTLSGGVIGLGVGDFTRGLGSGTAQAQFTTSGGWAAYNADRAVNLGGASATIAWATATTGFNAQTLILGASTATNTVDLQNPLDLGTAVRTVQVDNGAAAVDGKLSGVLSGGAGGALTKTGAGTLSLSNSNTYTGTTTISAGTLQLGTGATTGTLSTSSAISNNSNLTINRGNAVAQGTDFSGAGISGTGSFTQAGTGTTTLNVANTFSGATTVSAGVLSLTHALAIQNSALDTTGTGTVTLSGVTTPTFGGLAGAVNLATKVTTGYSTVTALTLNPLSGTQTYSGVIADGAAGMTLTKTGSGTQVLSGANTYTGATTVTLGTLSLLASTFAPNGASFSIGNVTVQSGATLQTDRANMVGTLLTLTGGTWLESNGFGGSWTGPVTLGATSIISSAFNQTIAGNVSGPGGLTKNGAGTLTLRGTNSYLGTTTINAGTLTIDSSATQTLSGAISGAGALTKASGAGTLILSNAANDYSGVTTISGGLLRIDGTKSGTGAVNISASGALGGAGSVKGAVTAAVGTATAAGGAIRLANGAVGTLTLGSTLAFSGTTAFPNNLYFDLGAGAIGTDKIVLSTAAALPTNTGNAGGVLINLNQLAGSATPGTYPVIQGGAGSTMATTGYALATTAAGGNTYTISASGTDLQVGVATAAAGPAVAFWRGADSSVWTGANWNGSVAGSDPLVSIPGVGTDVTFSTTTPVALNLSNTLGADFEIKSLTLTTPAAGGITIGGTNMLTIDGAAGINSANTSGTNTISSKVGLGGSQTWTVATGGVLVVSGNITDFAGGYTLTKAGAGELRLSGLNYYTGGTTLNGGSLTFAGNDPIGIGPLTINGGYINRNGGSGTLPNNNPITINGNFTYGNINNNGFNFGTGLITLGNNVTITLQQNNPIFGGNITDGGAGRTLTINELTNGVTFNGNINTSGGVTVTGTGAGPVNLNGPASTYTGATTVSGILIDVNTFAAINTASSIGKGSVAGSAADLVLDGGTLRHSAANVATTNRLFSVGNRGGTIISNGTATNTLSFTGTGAMGFNGQLGVRTLTLDGTNTGNNLMALAIGDNGGATSLTKIGAGTWILSGTNTYTGPTNVNAGLLQYNAVGAIAGTGRNIRVTSPGAVSLGYTPAGSIQNDILSRINSASTGAFALTSANSDAFDFSASGNNFTGLSLGAVGSVTYTGPLTPNGTTYRLGGGGGTLTINPTAFTSSNDLVLFGNGLTGTLDFAGVSKTFGAITFGGGTTQNGTLTGTSFEVQSGTVSAVLAGAAANLTKIGAGAMTLQGANTYTGATILKAGTINLSGVGTILTSSGITLAGGGLTLTNAIAGEATLNRVHDSTGITSNGGTITYANTSGTTVYAETIGSVALTSGQLNLVEATNQAGAGSQTLTLAGLTRPGSTSAVTFSAATTGPQLSGNKNMFVVSGGGTTNANEIIAPWATVGTTAALQTDYAIYTSNYVTGRGTAATANDFTWSTAWAAASNYNFANTTLGTTLTATRNINTLRHTGGVETLTVATNANLGTLGILNGVASALTIAATGTGAVTLPTTAADKLYVNAGSAAITISAPIQDNTGALTLVKTGGGTLTLNVANSYSGGTVVNAGTLAARGTSGSGSDLALGTGPVTVRPGATLGISRMNVANDIYITDATIASSSGYAQEVFNGTITLGGSVILETGTQSGTRIPGNITGSGGLTIRDTRTDNVTTLSGTNTYTGPTTINGIAGFTNRVSFRNADANQWTAQNLIVPAGSTAVFHVGGATEFTSADIQTLAGLGTGTGGFASGSFICLDTASGNFELDKVIENANEIGLAKYGGNTLTITKANTFAGQIQIYGGTISVSSFNSVNTNPALGTVHSASSNLGAPTTVAGGTILMGRNFYGSSTKLIYTGSGETTDRVIAFHANGSNLTSTLDQSGTGLLKFTSDMVTGGRTDWTLALEGSTAGTGEFAGAVCGAAGNKIVKSGTGTWTLSGNNAFTGGVTINAGTLQLGNAGALNSTAGLENAVVFGANSTGTLALGGNSVTVANLLTNAAPGTPYVQNANGSAVANATLTVGNSTNANSTFPGTIQDGAGGGTLGLTKAGTGTLTLTGASTFTGATTVSGGRLQLDANAAGTLTSGLTVGTGATFGFTAGTASTLDLTGKPFSLGGTVALDIGGAGVYDALTVGAFTLTAPSAFTFNTIGGITSGATYTLLTSANDITTNGYGITGQVAGRLTLAPTINTKTVTLTPVLDEGVWNKAGGGIWSDGDPGATGGNWTNYKPTVAGDAALFGSAITGPATITVDSAHSVGYMRFDDANTYTIGANGSSNLTINNGAYPAAVVVNSGSHIIAENVLLTSSVVVSPASGTTLTVSGNLTGAGGVKLSDAGTLALSGVNTYTGATTVSAGTLNLTGSLSNTAITISGTGILNESAAGVIGGTASLTLNNNVTLTLPGDNTYTGPTAINAGTLEIGGAGRLGTSGTYANTITIAGGATFDSNTSSSFTVSGRISGGGSVIKNGLGTLTMASTNGNTFSGGTIVNAGTLRANCVDTVSYNPIGALGGGNVTVNNGGTIEVLFANSLVGYASSPLQTTTINTGGLITDTDPNGTTNHLKRLVMNGGTLSATKANATWSNWCFDEGVSTPGNGTSSLISGGNAALTQGGGTVFNIGTSDTLTISTALDYVTESDGGIPDSGLIKRGSGLLILSAANTYRSDTTVEAGTLQIAGAGSLGAAGSYAGNITNNGTFLYSSSAAQTLSGVISGSGSLTKDTGSASTLTLSGANSYTGPTAVNVGKLVARNATSLGTGSAANVSVASGAALEYKAAADAPLAIGGTLTVNSGATIGTSIGSDANSAAINVTGNATIINGAHAINIHVIPGVPHATGLVTLIHGGAGSLLAPATAPTLVAVYNNTDFTIDPTAGDGGTQPFTRTDTDIQVNIVSATTLTGAYWTGGLAGNTKVWCVSNGTTASNWVTAAGGGATPLVPGAGANVVISANSVAAAPTATVLGANMTIQTLTISDTTNGLGLNADDYALTITPTDPGTGITMTADVPASTIAANVVLGAAQTWKNDSVNALTVSGAISGTVGLTKAGTGTLILSGDNPYTGDTTVSAGTLKLPYEWAVQNSTVIMGGGSAAVVFDSAETANAFWFGGLAGSGSGAGYDIALQNNAGTPQPIALTVGGNNATTTYAGVLSGGGSLTKTGTAALTLSNAASTYAGATNIAASTMIVSKLADGNSPSSIGASTNASTNLLLGNNTTLRYTGAEDSTDRQFRFNGDAAGISITLDASGTGPINFTSATGPTHSNVNQTRTLNLIGSNTGKNTLAAAIANNGTGVLSVVKDGVGKWVLTGANTYTGTTTVKAGTLLVNNSIGTGAVTVNSGGTIGGVGSIGGAVTVNAGGTVAPGGSVGALTANGNFAMGDGSIYEWQLAAKTGANWDLITAAGINLTGLITFEIDNSLFGGSISATDSFVVASTTTGTIANSATFTFILPSGWTGGTLALSSGSKELILSGLTSLVPGDTNGDKVVDAADFINLKKNFGAGVGGGLSVGNFDNTGTVNWADLSILMSHIGTGGGAPATTPEPATLGLLAIGALAMLRRRK